MSAEEVQAKSPSRGRLFLIPIKIGDASPSRYQPAYNIECLERIRHFVVEQARTARQYIRELLPDADISSLTLVEVDKHKGYSYPREEVLGWLRGGHDVGLMSEAGCPAVADPGSLVVADCHREGIQIVPLVGPSSILLSLMASGFNGQSFAFHGYLPFEEPQRQRLFGQMKRRITEGETQIFIEAPYRNDRLITELAKDFSPQQELCVAVDLTTPEELIHRQALGAWQKEMRAGLSFHKRPAIFLLGR